MSSAYKNLNPDLEKTVKKLCLLFKIIKYLILNIMQIKI